MSYNVGPHDYDCQCPRCGSRRAAIGYISAPPAPGTDWRKLADKEAGEYDDTDSIGDSVPVLVGSERTPIRENLTEPTPPAPAAPGGAERSNVFRLTQALITADIGLDLMQGAFGEVHADAISRVQGLAERLARMEKERDRLKDDLKEYQNLGERRDRYPFK